MAAVTARGRTPATPPHPADDIRPDWIIAVLSAIGLICFLILDWLLR